LVDSGARLEAIHRNPVVCEPDEATDAKADFLRPQVNFGPSIIDLMAVVVLEWARERGRGKR